MFHGKENIRGKLVLLDHQNFYEELEKKSKYKIRCLVRKYIFIPINPLINETKFRLNLNLKIKRKFL